MSAFHDNALMGASGSQGYQISRSVRLRSSASAYFNRTNASSPTNAIKWTWSGWVKRGSLGAQQNLVGATNSGSDDTYFNFNSSDKIVLGSYTGAGTDYGITTAAVFRDPSAWYHVVTVLDTANATSADRAIIYVNGVRQTVTNSANGMWPQNATNNKINTASQVVNIGRRSLGDSYLDGYLTEVNFIDGQALTPSSFGENDTVTGVWKPKKYAGTYGTNGFYLNFSDNSAATAAAIGKDYSGNGNNWTPNNISVTSGTTYDSMLDVPTMWADGGNGRGNYAVLNPLDKNGGSVVDGNLNFTNGAATNYMSGSTIVPTMPIYAEFQPTAWGNGNMAVGLRTSLGASNTLISASGGVSYNLRDGTVIYNGTTQGTYTAATGTTDKAMMAYDPSSGKLWFGLNGTWFNSGNPAAGTGQVYTITTPTDAWRVYIQAWDTTNAICANFGQRPFTYTPPSGFKALNTQNLPDSTIKKGNQYFDATTYTGNGSTQTITNSGAMQPDFAWIKSRSNALNSGLMDSVRGPTKLLISNATNAEQTLTDELTSFNSNGFSLGASSNGYTNFNTYTYVAWQWQAGAGTTSSNTSGSITSTVSVNATAGFSVATFTSQSSGSGTFGHGLGVAPNMVIVKTRGVTSDWYVYHSSLPSAAYYLLLDTTAAQATAINAWGSTAPTSSVVTLGSAWAASYTMVAYCFAAVAGYSAFGKYTGNGSTDGPFVFCGFRPRWIMIKRTDSTGSWLLIDTTRNPSNNAPNYLLADSSTTEGTDNVLDILSNGFKQRNAGVSQNASGGTYIYAAFAENPFKNALAR